MRKSTPKRFITRRPRGSIALPKLLGDIPTTQVKDREYTAPTQEEFRRVMSALGRIGGPKGGKARARKLSAKRRSDIAKRAALVRWSSEDTK